MTVVCNQSVVGERDVLGVDAYGEPEVPAAQVGVRAVFELIVETALADGRKGSGGAAERRQQHGDKSGRDWFH